MLLPVVTVCAPPPLRLTVPLLCVKLPPEFVQLPPTDNVPVGAVNVPLESVTVFDTVAFVSPDETDPPEIVRLYKLLPAVVNVFVPPFIASVLPLVAVYVPFVTLTLPATVHVPVPDVIAGVADPPFVNVKLPVIPTVGFDVPPFEASTVNEDDCEAPVMTEKSLENVNEPAGKVIVRIPATLL